MEKEASKLKAALEANPPEKKSFWALKKASKMKKVEATKPLLPPGTSLVGHTSKLPHRMRAQYDKTRRRLRKKQRIVTDKRAKEKKRQHRKEQAIIRSKARWG